MKLALLGKVRAMLDGGNGKEWVLPTIALHELGEEERLQ